MSLSLEGLALALEEWRAVEKRLIELIGFNPATSNHYGMIRLYNQRINSKTTDEEILGIRSAFLSWKKEILEMLEEKGIAVDDELWGGLFYIDGMYGPMSFLGVDLDIYSGIDEYREALETILNTNALLDEERKRYRILLKTAMIKNNNKKEGYNDEQG